jgi:hypothetical protein
MKGYQNATALETIRPSLLLSAPFWWSGIRAKSKQRSIGSSIHTCGSNEAQVVRQRRVINQSVCDHFGYLSLVSEVGK